MTRNNDGIGLLLLLMFGAALFSITETQETPQETTPALQVEQQAPEPMQQKLKRQVHFVYDVQVGELYTGVPTPLVALGEFTCEVETWSSLSPCYAPGHWRPYQPAIHITTPSGDHCLFSLPFLGSGVSTLQCDGSTNPITLHGEVTQQGDTVNIVGRLL